MNATPEECGLAWHEPTLVASLLVLAFIDVMVVLGNLLVIAAVLVSSKLRSVTNLFIMSLAVADLMVGIAVLPFSATWEVFKVWIFGDVWCSIWLAVDVWMCTASILNLCAISLDRYVAVTRPITYPSIMSARRAKMLIAGVWVLSFVICFPPLVGWRDNKEELNPLLNESIVEKPPTPDPRETENGCPWVCELTNDAGYVVYSALGSFYIPMLVMLFFYWRIYRAAVQTTRAINQGFRTTKGGTKARAFGNRFEEQRLTLRIHRGRSVMRHGGGGSIEGSPSTTGTNASAANSLCGSPSLAGSAGRSPEGRRAHERVKISVSYPSSETLTVPGMNGGSNPMPVPGTSPSQPPSPLSSHRSSISASPPHHHSGTIYSVHYSAAVPVPGVGRSSSDVTPMNSYVVANYPATRRRDSAIVMTTVTAPPQTPTTTATTPTITSVGHLTPAAARRPLATRRRSSCDSACHHRCTTDGNLSAPVPGGDISPSPTFDDGTPKPKLISKMGKRNIKAQVKRFRMETKAAKTLGIIVGGFIFCWLPFFTMYLIRAFCEECIHPLLFSILFWLGYCNSAINPCIYALFSKDFRFAFKRIICRCFCAQRSGSFRSRGAGGHQTGQSGRRGSDGSQLAGGVGCRGNSFISSATSRRRGEHGGCHIVRGGGGGGGGPGQLAGDDSADNHETSDSR